MMGDHFGTKFQSFYSLTGVMTGAMTGIKKRRRQIFFHLLKNVGGSLWNQIPPFSHHVPHFCGTGLKCGTIIIKYMVDQRPFLHHVPHFCGTGLKCGTIIIKYMLDQ